MASPKDVLVGPRTASVPCNISAKTREATVIKMILRAFLRFLRTKIRKISAIMRERIAPRLSVTKIVEIISKVMIVSFT